MLRFALSILLSVALWSCSMSGRVGSTLSEAETLMENRPDSALALLSTIDPSEIHGKSALALHALLLNRAQFKNYIDVPDDSLISIAVDYYDGSGNMRYSMLAHHYCGAINLRMGRYSQSLMHLLKAHGYAAELDDKFWMAMTARELYYVYNETYNACEGMRFAEISLENFIQVKKPEHIRYAMLDLGGAYMRNGRFEQAICIIRQLVDSALKYNDNVLEIEAKRALGLTYLNAKDYKNAKPCYEEIINMPSNNVLLSDSLYLLLSYMKGGEIDKAVELSSKCSDLSTGLGNWMQYEIYEALDSFPQAMRALETMNHEADSVLRCMLTSNISGTLLEYYDYQAELHRAELKTTKVIVWSISILALIMIGIGSALFYRYRQNQKEQISRNVEIAQNLREMIAVKDSQAQATIHNLLAERFAVLDNLCKILYEKGNSPLARKQISNEIDSLVRQFSTDEAKLTELGEYVNLHYKGIIDRLRNDFPDMRESDYRLFIYSILGFSNSVIAMFLGEEKITAVYARRKRLKAKFKASESQYKDEYIKSIS